MNKADTIIPASKRNLELLIIDNDPITCTIQEYKLKSRFPHPINVFENAREALDFMAGATTTDFLVLLDIDMPEMDGFEFLTEWQKTASASEIKVIMLSCSINTNDKEESQTYPQVVDYFEKPLYNSHLDILEEVIDSF